MKKVNDGNIGIKTMLCLESPTPLAYHILKKFADVPELMAPERVILSNIERMKKAILARKVTLFCLSCGEWSAEKRIRELPERPMCEKCGAGLLARLRFNQDPNRIGDILKWRLKGRELDEEDLEQLTYARRTADLILSHGKKALIALQVRGVGPEIAFRILGKMHSKEDNFYMDLLKAKIQYLRTKPYWGDKKEEVARR
jgi:ATP-dependent Lhr-like helicase